jgi:hypothetical protein
VTEDLPRDELEAAVEARKELGREHEPEIVDAFLARVEKQIDERVDQRVAQSRYAPQRRGGGSDWGAAILGIASLGIGIGATGAAVSHSGQGWVAAVAWLAIIVVNLLYHQNRSR